MIELAPELMIRLLHHIKRLLLFSSLLIALWGIGNYGYGQAANDYRTVATGNWNNIAVWQRYNGTAWVAAAASPTSTANVITIRNGHTVTVSASVTIDQTIIEAGGQVTVNATQTLTIANGAAVPDMTVDGTLVNSGTITTTGTLDFNSGSTYQHARNGGTIPVATWNAASTCNITGITGTEVTINLNQTFGNFIWNCPAQTVNPNTLNGMNGISIAGDFNLISTGTGSIRLGSATSRSFTILGNFNISGGTYNLSTGVGTGTIYIEGNFTMSGGTITETSTGRGAFVFNGTINQNFIKTGGTISNNIDFTVNSGSNFDMGTNVLNGSTGSFTLSSGATLTTANNQGISTSPTLSGSIQVTGSRNFNTGANYVYNGTVAQITGTGLPGTVNNLTVNNNAGITLTGTVTVSNFLTMTQGNLTTGTNILAISNSSAGALNRVSGTIIGRFMRAVNTTSADYLFPVGTASFYRPAIMNFASLSAGTNITAEFIATPPAGFSAYTDGISDLDNVFTEGYWRFYSSGLPAATYSLNLTCNGFTSYTINEASRITGRDNSNTTWRALGTHGTRSGNDVSRTGITNLNTTSFDFALAHGCIPVSLSYKYERNITIDYTRISGGSDLFNFPVLFSLTGQNFLRNLPTGQITNANGFDIIFTDNNYNKLDHQIEYYNGTNGDLIAWIRIPTLSSSSNTVIKILYGNPQVTADPSVTSVWDSHYKGVWHLDDNNLDDFTSFDKAATPYNTPTYPAGMIFNSLELNGTTQYAEVINAPNTNFAGNITVSAWVRMDVGGRDQKIAGNQNNSSGGYKFGIFTNNKVEFEIRNSANIPSLNRDVLGGTVLSTGQWYYLAGMSSDVLDSIKTFVNGIPERPFKKTGLLGTASDNLTIGKEPFLSNYYFDGRFDELRISDKVRSNGWLRTEYNNQSSPSTFYSVGTESVSANIPSESSCTGPLTLTFGYPSGGTYSGNPYITGNVFTPPSAGTYAITYTYTGGCGSGDITKNFIITDAAPAPIAPDKEFCANQITYLEATSGENIRWYDGGTLVSTANPYSTGQTAAGTYNYTVTQTVNGCESAATDVSLTIFSDITIITQPQPITICQGNNVDFNISVTGYNLTYQWQEDGADITDGGIYSGATTSTLTLTNPGITKNGKLYSCVISTTCGTSPVNSTTALLTVITDQTWTGALSNDWNDPGNWTCGLIPLLTNSVQIPNVSNKPVLNSGAVGTVNNLTINIGSSLTVDGNILQIAGSVTNNGTFDASTGTIEFNGTAAQSLGSDVFTGNTIGNLIVNNTAGVTLQDTLKIPGIVNVQSGDLASGGYLTLLSTATQTALIDGSGGGSVSGNITMQRYLPSGFGYKYFSSPFQAATVNEFADDMTLGSFTFYKYDENRTSSGWVSYHSPTTNPLIPLQGYAINFGSVDVTNTVDVTGVVNNGSQSVTLYNNNNTYTQGFNLTGNPYPSPINWDAASGWTKTNIDDALYYFKASTTDQYGGTYSTYINKATSDGLATNIIPSMQGFFVHVSSGAFPVTGTLALDNSVRITDLTHSFIKSGKEESRPLLRLIARFSDDPVSADPAVIYFDEKAETAFDSKLDALKLMNTDLKVPNFYAFGSDGSKLSIDALPATLISGCSVPLGIKMSRTGNVILSVSHLDPLLTITSIFLSDITAGVNQDLLPGNEYTLPLAAGEYTNRFFLYINSIPTDIAGVNSDDYLFRTYYSMGVLRADINLGDLKNGTLVVTNLTGRKIFIREIYDSGHYEFAQEIQPGIYIVTLNSGNRRISRKIFVYK